MERGLYLYLEKITKKWYNKDEFIDSGSGVNPPRNSEKPNTNPKCSASFFLNSGKNKFI